MVTLLFSIVFLQLKHADVEYKDLKNRKLNSTWLNSFGSIAPRNSLTDYNERLLTYIIILISQQDMCPSFKSKLEDR